MQEELISSLASLFERDLTKLGEEINMYGNESDLWEIRGEIKNSAGNLCLHLCGNLQHFIGTVIGNTGYQRNRDNEFAAKGVPKSELLELVKTTQDAVSKSLQKAKAADLQATYPIEVFGRPMSTLYFLVHLQGHLNYHLGQVNYHRRLVAHAS
jgi:uncharacterized damage-inducible protein DinB